MEMLARGSVPLGDLLNCQSASPFVLHDKRGLKCLISSIQLVLAKYLRRLQPPEPPNPSLRGTSHIAICDAGGNSDVVYYAAERKPYGTREDEKAGGDAEAAAREGGHAAAVQGPESPGSTREVLVRPAPAVGLDNGLPDRAKCLKRFQPPEPPTIFTRYVTYCNM